MEDETRTHRAARRIIPTIASTPLLVTALAAILLLSMTPGAVAHADNGPRFGEDFAGNWYVSSGQPVHGGKHLSPRAGVTVSPSGQPSASISSGDEVASCNLETCINLQLENRPGDHDAATATFVGNGNSHVELWYAASEWFHENPAIPGDHGWWVYVDETVSDDNCDTACSLEMTFPDITEDDCVLIGADWWSKSGVFNSAKILKQNSCPWNDDRLHLDGADEMFNDPPEADPSPNWCRSGNNLWRVDELLREFKERSLVGDLVVPGTKLLPGEKDSSTWERSYDARCTLSR